MNVIQVHGRQQGSIYRNKLNLKIQDTLSEILGMTVNVSVISARVQPLNDDGKSYFSNTLEIIFPKIIIKKQIPIEQRDKYYKTRLGYIPKNTNGFLKHTIDYNSDATDDYTYLKEQLRLFIDSLVKE